MKTKDWIILTAVLISLGLTALHQFDNATTAYVRSGDLLENYQGTKEAMAALDQRQAATTEQLQAIETSFRKEVMQYYSDSAVLSRPEKIERERYLGTLQQQLGTRAQTIRTAQQQDQAQVTEGLLNQLNALIEDYGRNNGYAVILGTNDTGTLLYADQAIDITDQLIAQLNESYQPH